MLHNEQLQTKTFKFNRKKSRQNETLKVLEILDNDNAKGIMSSFLHVVLCHSHLVEELIN